MTTEQIIDLLSFDNRRTVVFCGAGISSDSGMPISNRLIEYILHKLKASDEDCKFIKEHAFTFDMVLKILAQYTDISSLIDLFKECVPNLNHKLIARLAKLGYVSTICTTNIDILLEIALQLEGLYENEEYMVFRNESEFVKGIRHKKKIRIFKLHGCAEYPNSVHLALDRLNKGGYSKSMDSLLRHIFSGKKRNKVFVPGYSQNDETDINPLVENISKNQNEIIVLEQSDSRHFRSEDLNIKGSNNPFKNFPGERISGNNSDLTNALWTEFTGEVEIDQSLKVDNWKDFVDDWYRKAVHQKSEIINEIIVGTLLFEAGKFKKSKTCFKKVWDYGMQNSFHSIVLVAELNLGKIYHQLCSAQEATKYLLEVVNGSSGGERGFKMEALAELGNLNLQYNKYNKAVEYFEEALSVRIRLNHKQEEAWVLAQLGLSLLLSGNKKKGHRVLQTALKLAKRYSDKRLQARCFINLSVGYNHDGEMQKALEYLEWANEVCKYISDASICYEVNQYLGEIYLKTEQYKNAIEYSKKALKVGQKINSKLLEAKCFINLARAYQGIRAYDESLVYIGQAIPVLQTMDSSELKGCFYATAGNVYYELNNLTDSFDFIIKAEQVYTELEQYDKLQEMQKSLLKIHEQIGNKVNQSINGKK
ncbi:MAG: tetratricopeptide repeat protein [Bacteroidales bacterium]|nr:tetratricopeptide repeat protein [Bacteroidales bacterium]